MFLYQRPSGRSDYNCQQFRNPDLNSTAVTAAISVPYTVCQDSEVRSKYSHNAQLCSTAHQVQQHPGETVYECILKVCVCGTVGTVTVRPQAHRGSTLLPNLTRQGESQSVRRRQSRGKFRRITSQAHSSRTNSDKLEAGRIHSQTVRGNASHLIGHRGQLKVIHTESCVAMCDRTDLQAALPRICASKMSSA